MHYHLFKTSPTRIRIVTESQERHLTFPNFNILVQQVVSVKGRYDFIVLSIGGNYSPIGSSQTVANNIFDIAVAA